ncbi:hypothetical protein ANN_27345, partial [Periplaneta americana]
NLEDCIDILTLSNPRNRKYGNTTGLNDEGNGGKTDNYDSGMAAALSVEEHVFLVKTYWVRESIKNYQRKFVERFGGRHPSSKHCIQKLMKSLKSHRHC